MLARGKALYERYDGQGEDIAEAFGGVYGETYRAKSEAGKVRNAANAALREAQSEMDAIYAREFSGKRYNGVEYGDEKLAAEARAADIARAKEALTNRERDVRAAESAYTRAEEAHKLSQERYAAKYAMEQAYKTYTNAEADRERVEGLKKAASGDSDSPASPRTETPTPRIRQTANPQEAEIDAAVNYDPNAVNRATAEALGEDPDSVPKYETDSATPSPTHRVVSDIEAVGKVLEKAGYGKTSAVSDELRLDKITLETGIQGKAARRLLDEWKKQNGVK